MPSTARSRVGPANDDQGMALDVEAAAAGDRQAFARLYRSYGPMVHGIVLSGVQRYDVADLVQEVFLTALRRLPSLREPAAFGGWLASIARNAAVDHRRQVREMEPWTERASRRAAPSQRVEAHRVLDTIRRLPEAYRETLVLRLVEGLSGPEIASRTGMTEGSVRVNLHRGMKRLREQLGGRDE